MLKTNNCADITGLYAIGAPVVSVIDCNDDMVAEFGCDDIERLGSDSGYIYLTSKIFRNLKKEDNFYNITITQKYGDKIPENNKEVVYCKNYSYMRLENLSTTYNFDGKTTFDYTFVDKDNYGI